MTSRERLHVAMGLGEPDRVPFMCQLSIGHMLLQLGCSPVEFWNDPDVFAHGLVQLRAMYDFDGVLISLHGHDPDWQKTLKTRKSTPEGELVEMMNGSQFLYPSNDLPQCLTDDSRSRPLLSEIVESDLPYTLNYIPVSQGLRFIIHPLHPFGVFRRVRSLVGSDVAVHGEITSPFNYFLDFFGHEQGLMNLVDYPTKSKLVLAHFTRLVSQLASAMCSEDIDAIKISTPFAGAGFISLDFYREFVLPYEKQIALTIRQRGTYV